MRTDHRGDHETYLRHQQKHDATVESPIHLKNSCAVTQHIRFYTCGRAQSLGLNAHYTGSWSCDRPSNAYTWTTVNGRVNRLFTFFFIKRTGTAENSKNMIFAFTFEFAAYGHDIIHGGLRFAMHVWKHHKEIKRKCQSRAREKDFHLNHQQKQL